MTTEGLDLRGAQVLIVDDNPVNLRVLWRVLEEAGYRVLVATNGANAVQLAARARPEAILLDVRMPEMDGFAACRYLKASDNTRGIPVLFITADDHIEAMMTGFDAGGVDYITKPFRKEEVLMRLRTHLTLSRLTGELARKNRLLEEENERKGQELLQARNLQLSMLPRQRPELPHLELSWHMSTATEVGGDYCDYRLADDGTLTVVLGDAIGHGLQAGIVVIATKSLLQSLEHDTAIVDCFHAVSRHLLGMNLQRLGMAMVMLKLQGHHLRVSSAGIPGMLIYRQATQTVEEVEIPGTPLGLARESVYEERQVELQCGDVVLLMSDGLPEQRNAADEMLGYERATAMFRAVAHQTADAICESMARQGAEWAGDQPQGDDITFVALRVR